MATRCITMLCLIVALTPSPARAQDPARSFDQLRTVAKVGDTVTVSDRSGATSKGSITELTASALVLRLGSDERRYTEADVTQIRQLRSDPLLNGMVIGAAAGAILGLIVNSAGGCSNSSGCYGATGAVFALGVGVGAGLGLGIDAANRKTAVIYEAATNRAALRLSPMLARGRIGAMISLVH